MTKLHLGCGEVYLDGYVNIDFPPTRHSVQTESVADRQADVLQLSYEPGSVDEVRLHHLLEHFPRSVACALLVGWREWLKEGGVLRIEVPDFAKMAQIATRRVSRRSRRHLALRHIFGANDDSDPHLALRHIFGSHEAPWAIHCEGWSEKLIVGVLTRLDYELVALSKPAWKGTHNLDVVARKSSAELVPSVARERVENYLKSFLVDQEAEQGLLAVWMDQYDKQLALTRSAAL